MRGFKFDVSFLSELGLMCPVTVKLVYLYIVVDRGAREEVIRDNLGLGKKEVRSALKILIEEEMLTVDGRGRHYLT